MSAGNSTEERAFEPFPLEEKLFGLLAEMKTAEPAESTGLHRDFYLDIAEPIVRAASQWVDSDGRVIDPYRNREGPTTTARFVAAVAILIGAGRCQDLTGVAVRAMDRASEDLCHASQWKTPGSDFFTRDLIMGYRFLRHKVSAEHVGRWKHWLGVFDPEETYWDVARKKECQHNWNVYAIVGEFLKSAEGIADNREFIERYLEYQRQYFTPYGMYKDPGDPITYDYTVRQGLSLMFFSGYHGPHRPFYDEMLRRGGLTTLFALSPKGEAAYGGRSNQFHIMEAMLACIFEFEAQRYAVQGDIKIAGMFKRAAHFAAKATRRWLDEIPFRHIKNRFHPVSRHGCDSYGHYDVYSLLAANLFGVAYLMADERIGEWLCPFERGGYIIKLPEDFHKIFATCRGYHIQIDTRGDHAFDATGLGRLHRIGAPSELALSSSIVSSPKYEVAVSPFRRSVAIGPGWQDTEGEWHYLADYEDEIASVTVEQVKESVEEVAFRVIYSGRLGSARSVIEHYRLNGKGLEIRDELPGDVQAGRVCVPLLYTDGLIPADIERQPWGFRVRYEGWIYEVICRESNLKMGIEEGLAPNRNGIYRIAFFEKPASIIKYELRLVEE